MGAACAAGCACSCGPSSSSDGTGAASAASCPRAWALRYSEAFSAMEFTGQAHQVSDGRPGIDMAYCPCSQQAQDSLGLPADCPGWALSAAGRCPPIYSNNLAASWCVQQRSHQSHHDCEQLWHGLHRVMNARLSSMLQLWQIACELMALNTCIGTKGLNVLAHSPGPKGTAGQPAAGGL